MNIFTTIVGDNKGLKNIYEARVTSIGSSATINVVMPYLIRSIFEEFPGKSGSTKDYEFIMK